MNGHFRSKPSNVALQDLLKERYTIHDAANRREPREYAQKILRGAKDCRMDERNQLNSIYNGIDIEVRVEDLRRSREIIILNECFQKLLSLQNSDQRTLLNLSSLSRRDELRAFLFIDFIEYLNCCAPNAFITLLMFEHDALRTNLKYLLNFFLTYLHLNLNIKRAKKIRTFRSIDYAF